MQEQNIDPNHIIRTTAKEAAKAAASDFTNNNAPVKTEGNGVFALYTWGTLALVCALYAGATGVFPNLGIISPPSIMAQHDAAKESQPDVVMAVQEAVSPRNTMPVQTASVISDDHLDGIDYTTTGSINKQETASIAPSLNLGANIGQSSVISELAIRYMALNKRAPDIFSSLQPRLKFTQEGENKLAVLIAGPFASKSELSNFCREVRLRLTVDCSSAAYSGEVFQID